MTNPSNIEATVAGALNIAPDFGFLVTLPSPVPGYSDGQIYLIGHGDVLTVIDDLGETVDVETIDHADCPQPLIACAVGKVGMIGMQTAALSAGLVQATVHDILTGAEITDTATLVAYAQVV